MIRTVAANCAPPPPWPDTWPCDYCAQPVTGASSVQDLGDGTIYLLQGAYHAWHDDCRDCLGGPRP